jgi:hypothetical protein
MKNYLVCGWISGDNYDSGKPANQCLPIRAKDESEAEDKADRKFKEKIGKCAVIVATEVE